MTFGFEVVNNNGTATIDSENGQLTINSFDYYPDNSTLSLIGDKQLWSPNAESGDISIFVTSSETLVQCPSGIIAAKAVPAKDATNISGEWGIQVFDGSSIKVFDSRKKIASPIITTSVLASSIPEYPSSYEISLPAPKHGKKRYITYNFFGLLEIKEITSSIYRFVSLGVKFYSGGNIAIYKKESGDAPPTPHTHPSDARIYLAILDA